MLVSPELGFPKYEPTPDPQAGGIVAPTVTVRGKFQWQFYAAIAAGLYIFLRTVK